MKKILEERQLIFVRLPLALHKKLKSYCVEKDTTMQKLLEKFVRELLK